MGNIEQQFVNTTPINRKNSIMLLKLRIAIKLVFTFLFAKQTWLINDEKYNKLIFFIMFGRVPNFDNPKTFNEFICARKVRLDEYYLWPYTDKYEVRKYVKETIGEKYLNDIIGIFNDFSEIHFPDLPDKFVLKATHGSRYNIIVRNKDKLNVKIAKRKFDKWLKENYYYKGREMNYYNIKPRIICDAFLESKNNIGLPEFKVFCFNGKAKLISYNLIINGKTYANYYTANWEKTNIYRGFPNFDCDELPQNKDEIIKVAEKLSAIFEFVRVDLYNVDERIVFSELTFHSGGGFNIFKPKIYDEKFAVFFNQL